jgi:amino acid transporter
MWLTDFYIKIKHLLLGGARNIEDPRIFHQISLVAFFAWVGLGADGLSSCCYGPEEAYLALQGHTHLGIFVALATAITIFVITASYSQIVELFPAGGGGYHVATKLLSPSLGMVAGCALLIDYVLTITISVASGADAIFSFLPHNWIKFRLPFAILGVLLLIILNLRGVKESVLPLVPVFLTFLITHVIAIVMAIFIHSSDLPATVSSTSAEVSRTYSEIGLFAMFFMILRAYSMGAGTFTGIEAVSNGIQILREPRVVTAKKTMRYMAVSLAFTAFGLMLGYILFKVQYVPGKTLNAVLFEKVTAGWNKDFGTGFVLVTLASEAVLLFVAAQTGFLGGPRVLSSMALDQWFPFQLAILSERLVIKYSIMIMGLSSIAFMILTRGSVKFLVILYSINVFITFCLSQAGMVRHWWQIRKSSVSRGWKRRISINGIGLTMTTFILISVTVIKFNEGGWITLLVTGTLMAIAITIKRYYHRTQKQLTSLNKLVETVELSLKQPPPFQKQTPAFDEKAKTAVILVSGFKGTGLHTLYNVRRLFGEGFKNFIFLEIGIVDAGHFKGPDAVHDLEEHVKSDLALYESFMKREGYPVKTFSAIGTDVADEICETARAVHRQYPQSVFFAGQLVFKEETLLDRILSNKVVFVVQRRLHREGIPFIIMPLKIG